MKICLVSLRGLDCHLAEPRTIPGGSEVQTALLGSALASRGHEISVIVVDYVGEITRAPRSTPFPLLNAYDTRSGVRGLRFLHPRWTGLHAALSRAGADLYFQRGAGAATGQVAWFCARAGRPFVYGAASDTDTDPRRVRLGRRDRRLYRFGLRRADRVVVQHELQRTALRRNYGVAAEVIGSIVSSIPADPASPLDPPRVLWLGNLRAVKRPELLLETARRFPDVRFTMVGGPVPGEPQVFSRIREAAAAFPNVRFTGPVGDPSPYISGSRFLLNTSIVEGFPSSFLEAWAHGVPVVSTVDPGGVVSREDLGLVGDDPESLYRAIDRMLADRAYRDAAGLRAREYVRAHHAPDRVAAAYERLFLGASRQDPSPSRDQGASTAAERDA